MAAGVIQIVVVNGAVGWKEYEMSAVDESGVRYGGRMKFVIDWLWICELLLKWLQNKLMSWNQLRRRKW